MTFTIEPIGGSFAVEVQSLDLWRRLDDATTDALRRAWGTHGVLVFRRQSLSEDEMLAFFSLFGEPEVIVRTDWQSKNRPEAINISNMKNLDGNAIGGLGAGELDWHTDQSYVTDPATGALLYMVEMPRDGGKTYWANLRLAYDGLEDATKEKIEGLSAIYDYLKRQSTYDDEEPMSDELREKTPPLMHPIVNTDPVTGEKSLYLDPTTTTGIADLPDDEGQALLDALNAHATGPEFVYAHEWRIGDVVMWDNGFLLHRRDAFESDKNRWLKRLTVKLSPEHHIVPTSILVAA
ncbi:MAG: TauD/TfdA family dioxygenase [Rhodospirillales bacterium]